MTRTLNDLIKRKFYVNQIYEMGCSEAEILKEALLYLDNIESWLRKHIPSQPNRLNAAQPTSSNISQDNFTITDICDIEESIWLPKYGMEFVEEYSFENFKFRLLTKIAWGLCQQVRLATDDITFNDPLLIFINFRRQR